MYTRTLFYIVFFFSAALFSFVAFNEGVTAKLMLLFLCLIVLFLGGFTYEIETRLDNGRQRDHDWKSDDNILMPPH